MTDPTDDHPFTFGCFRAVETPDIPPIDAPIDEPAGATETDDAPFDDPTAIDDSDPIDDSDHIDDGDVTGNTDGTTPTPIPDGGPALAGECPTCEGDLANVQGVPACPDCTWTAA